MKKQKVLLLIFIFWLVFAYLVLSLFPSHNAAVASSNPLATKVGIKILEKGGNAFDAAVAVSAMLGVVEPYGSGLGGGGFWLLHVESGNTDVMVDGREKAPLAAGRDMYLDKKGNVIPRASVDGPLAAGIPGVPAALEHITKKYGSMTLRQLLKPAIKYANKGFKVDVRYRRLAKFRLQALRKSPAAAEIFLRDGNVPKLGEKIIQHDLAKTLERIVLDGAPGFYRGVISSKMVDEVNENGGAWSNKDLHDYAIVEREPIVINYKGMRVVSASPPSSGGVALAQMLNMLSHFEFDKLDEVERIHILAEIMRRAYRDRAEYLGDSDVVNVPIDRLISQAHAQMLIKDIRMGEATPSEKLKVVATKVTEGNNTTHFSIIDADGNRVAATLSLNYPFGSGYMAEGTGVLLNDEMDDFSAKPGVPNVYGLIGAEANSIVPGKRMLSSMSPTFVETEDRIAVLGTPGGSRIISMVLLSMLEFYNGADAEQMVNLTRFHHQYLPDNIYFEPHALDDKSFARLFEMGHEPEELGSVYGNMQVVIVDKISKQVEAASDHRGSGLAMVVD